MINDLDIFGQAGHATAHDEYVSFSVKGDKLRIKDQVANFDGRLHVQLVKGSADNPKINALYVKKGSIDGKI